MYNRLIGEINFQGYDITVRYSDISGRYLLSTLAKSMGEVYRESMVADENPMDDQSITEKFIKQIENNK